MTNPNYFALFGLEPSFSVDQAAVRAAYRQLQTEHHPDKFTTAGESEKLKAIQFSASINDAYQCLQEPVKRAKYVLALKSGQAVTENNLVAEPAFLMQQIEAREQLENFADNGGDYDQLMDLIDLYQAQLEQQCSAFEQALEAEAWQTAEVTIAKMQLFSKLLHEASELEDELD